MRDEYGLRMSDNRVLRKIVGHKRNEVTRDWRTLHNEKLHDLYSSPNIIWVIKSRKRWVKQVDIWERREMYTQYCWGNLRETDHWEDLGIDSRIILK
jgi:hypothetical protein